MRTLVAGRGKQRFEDSGCFNLKDGQVAARSLFGLEGKARVLPSAFPAGGETMTSCLMTLILTGLSAMPPC